MGNKGMWAALVALGALTGCGDRWDHYTWRASSAGFGLPQSGKLDFLGQHELLLHTSEEPNPWVIVDMLEERVVSRIVVQNRLDCCQERGLPMIVELGTTSDHFEEVGRQQNPFDTWEVSVPNTKARYVRVRAASRTYLHLRAIQIP
jgi:hypothetical protein